MRLFFLGLIAGLAISMVSCQGQTLNVKIYRLNPVTDQLDRAQNNEHIPVSTSKDFYCTQKDDLIKIVDAYQSCQQMCQGGQ